MPDCCSSEVHDLMAASTEIVGAKKANTIFVDHFTCFPQEPGTSSDVRLPNGTCGRLFDVASSDTDGIPEWTGFIVAEPARSPETIGKVDNVVSKKEEVECIIFELPTVVATVEERQRNRACESVPPNSNVTIAVVNEELSITRHDTLANGAIMGVPSTGILSRASTKSMRRELSLSLRTTALKNAMASDAADIPAVWKTVIRALAGPFLGIVCMFVSYSSIDFRDPLDGKNWWRCMIPCATIWQWILAAQFSAGLDHLVYRNILGQAFPWQECIKMGLLGSSVCSTLWWLEKQMLMYPIPFHGVWAAASGYLAMVLYCFFTVDRQSRTDPDVFWALVHTMCFNFLWLILNVAYWMVTVFYTKAPRPAQFLVALVFGALLKAFMAIVETLFSYLDSSSVFLGYNVVYINHAIYLAVVIGSSGDWTTAWAVIISDALLNILAIKRVLTGKGVLGYYLPKLLCGRCRRFAEPTAEQLERSKLLGAAVVSVAEPAEFLMPVFYLLAFWIAYNGPNAKWMGGIKATAWHYSAVHDFGQLVASILLMTLCDSILIVATTLLFRRFNVSLFNYYSKCLEMYWLPSSLIQCFAIDHQFCIVVLHCGMDFTFSFDWL